jgi:hypothetical protein
VHLTHKAGILRINAFEKKNYSHKTCCTICYIPFLNPKTLDRISAPHTKVFFLKKKFLEKKKRLKADFSSNEVFIKDRLV